MKKNKLVAFSGLDGAGKSTQIHHLKTKFIDLNYKSVVVWSRVGYTQGMQKIKNFFRERSANVIPSPGDLETRKKKFDNKVIKRIWIYLSIIDLIILYSVYFRVKRLFGYIVIADRYIIDSLIDFKINFPSTNIEKLFLWKILVFISPKPDRHFIALISVTESLRRSSLKNEPFPDSEERLEYRKKMYEKYIKKNKYAFFLNCEKSIDEIHEIILSKLDLNENIPTS